MARRRVHGPYRHGNKFRIVLVEGAEQVVESFGSEAEAEAAKRGYEAECKEQEGIKVREALDQYEADQRRRSKPGSEGPYTMRRRVSNLLRDWLDRPLASITPAVAERCYLKMQEKYAAATHRCALKDCKTFMRWCASKHRRWIKRDPFAEVEGVGRCNKGKPQLRIDEVTKFVDKAHELAAARDIRGVVAIAVYYFGTRISELLARPVRDLDAGGRVLWIEDGKTENATRSLEVPPDLGVYLLAMADGKPGTALLFGGVSRWKARRMVRTVCDLAGVPRVSPHGLRGTHISIAREHGATPAIVAAAVGHGSYGITAQHYVRPGLDKQIQQRQALRVIQGGNGSGGR